MTAEVGPSISRIPGPPFGPSMRMTTTSPATTLPAMIACCASSSESNTLDRAEILQAVESRVLELAPIVPLYHTRGSIAMAGNVRGVEPGPFGLARVDLEEAWLAGEAPSR